MQAVASHDFVFLGNWMSLGRKGGSKLLYEYVGEVKKEKNNLKILWCLGGVIGQITGQTVLNKLFAQNF